MAPATVKDRSSNAHPRRRHATPLVRRAAAADGRRLTQCDGLQQSSDEHPARQSPAALRTQAASAHLSPFRHSSQSARSTEGSAVSVHHLFLPCEQTLYPRRLHRARCRSQRTLLRPRELIRKSLTAARRNEHTSTSPVSLFPMALSDGRATHKFMSSDGVFRQL